MVWTVITCKCAACAAMWGSNSKCMYTWCMRGSYTAVAVSCDCWCLICVACALSASEASCAFPVTIDVGQLCSAGFTAYWFLIGGSL